MHYCKSCGKVTYSYPDYYMEECIAYVQPDKTHRWAECDMLDKIICEYCNQDLAGVSTCSKNPAIFGYHHNFVTKGEYVLLKMKANENEEVELIKRYKTYGIDKQLIDKAVEQNVAHLKTWLLSKLKSSSNLKLLKELIRIAIKKNSEHCGKFFIDDEFKSKMNKVEKYEMISPLSIRKKYVTKSFSLSSPFPLLSALKITSNAKDEENISIVILVDRETTIEVQQKNIQELPRILNTMNASKGVYITTTDFPLTNFPKDYPIQYITGNTIADILIDLEIAIKPLYKIYEPHTFIFREW